MVFTPLQVVIDGGVNEILEIEDDERSPRFGLHNFGVRACKQCTYAVAT
jgi:hypothetical protein